MSCSGKVEGRWWVPRIARCAPRTSYDPSLRSSGELTTTASWNERHPGQRRMRVTWRLPFESTNASNWSSVFSSYSDSRSAFQSVIAPDSQASPVENASRFRIATRIATDVRNPTLIGDPDRGRPPTLGRGPV